MRIYQLPYSRMQEFVTSNFLNTLSAPNRKLGKNSATEWMLTTQIRLHRHRQVNAVESDYLNILFSILLSKGFDYLMITKN